MGFFQSPLFIPSDELMNYISEINAIPNNTSSFKCKLNIWWEGTNHHDIHLYIKEKKKKENLSLYLTN
jgi:hypothetical protein